MLKLMRTLGIDDIFFVPFMTRFSVEHPVGEKKIS